MGDKTALRAAVLGSTQPPHLDRLPPSTSKCSCPARYRAASWSKGTRSWNKNRVRLKESCRHVQTSAHSARWSVLVAQSSVAVVKSRCGKNRTRAVRRTAVPGPVQTRFFNLAIYPRGGKKPPNPPLSCFLEIPANQHPPTWVEGSENRILRACGGWTRFHAPPRWTARTRTAARSI